MLINILDSVLCLVKLCYKFLFLYRNISALYECDFKAVDRKTSTDVPDSTKKKRHTYPTMKQMIDFPFMMKYSYVGITSKQKNNIPFIFYKVKVTTCIYEYHCELSETFYNVAIKS